MTWRTFSAPSGKKWEIEDGTRRTRPHRHWFSCRGVVNSTAGVRELWVCSKDPRQDGSAGCGQQQYVLPGEAPPAVIFEWEQDSSHDPIGIIWDELKAFTPTKMFARRFEPLRAEEIPTIIPEIVVPPWVREKEGSMVEPAFASNVVIIEHEPPMKSELNISPDNADNLEVVITHALATADVAAVHMRATVGEQTFLITGSAKRDPRDKPDIEVGLTLATVRALESLTHKIARRVDGRIKHNDDMKTVVHKPKPARIPPPPKAKKKQAKKSKKTRRRSIAPDREQGGPM